MIRKTRLRWLVLALVLGLAGLAGVLVRTADQPVADGSVVVVASEPVVRAAPVEASIAPEPALIGVFLDRARSTAQFQLADGTKRSIAVNQQLQPGWTLLSVDSGSATFETRSGRKRVELGAGDAQRLAEIPAAQEGQAVLIPEVPARTEDGEIVTRCTDPEC
ncbi:hypothetical protein ACG3SL_04800 [Sphingomonas sp. CJ20]